MANITTNDLPTKADLTESDTVLVNAKSTSSKITLVNLFRNVSFSSLTTVAKNIISAINENSSSISSLTPKLNKNVSDIGVINTNLATVDIASKLTSGSGVALTYVYVKKSGNTVTLSVLLTCGTAPASGATLFTVASKYRPVSTTRGRATTYTGSAYGAALASLDTAGIAKIQGTPLYIYNLVTFAYQIA